MLRALMASASGCITLSLALHATLLWGATKHERPSERHVAVDVVRDAIALGLESERTQGERSATASGPPGSPPAHQTPTAVPATPPRPTHEPRPVRRANDRAPKPAAERALEKPAPPAQPGTLAAASPMAPVAPAPPAVESPATPPPSDDALSGSRGSGVPAAPGVVSALPNIAPGGNDAPHGNDGGAGNGGRRDGVGSSRGDGSDGTARRAALLDYASRVRARIAERREYPYAARRARLHGTVCLRIELEASGRLLDAEPTCGSSLALLTRAALAAVAKAAPFPPLPTALGQRLTLDVPVIFELED